MENNEKREPHCPITFLDYDKVSDTVMWLSPTCALKFCVRLKYRNKNGDYISFHSEYKTYSTTTERELLSVSLNQSAYFSIECKGDKRDYIIIRPNDISVLKMLYEKTILNWFIGDNKVFSIVDNNITITGKYTPVEVAINEQSYLKFSPIRISFDNGDMKEGLRIVINNSENFVDLTIDKMFEFFYYICNTDILNAAFNLLNYIKMNPYGENLVDLSSNRKVHKTNESFFNKL